MEKDLQSLVGLYVSVELNKETPSLGQVLKILVTGKLIKVDSVVSRYKVSEIGYVEFDASEVDLADTLTRTITLK